MKPITAVRAMKKWTPGPWQVFRINDDSRDIWYDIWSPEESQSVAHVVEMAREGAHLRRIKQDAQLIAASPVLIEALSALRQDSNDGGCWCDAVDRGRREHSIECKKARAAIALVR